MLFLWIKIKKAAFIYLSANNKKEKIDRDLWAVGTHLNVKWIAFSATASTLPATGSRTGLK